MTYEPPTVPGPPSQPPPYPGPPVGPYPPLAGEQLGSAVAPPRGRNNTLLFVLCGVVAVLVLCCGGGATLVYQFRDEFSRSLAAPSPTPTRSRPPLPDWPQPSAQPSLPPGGSTDTENMEPGATLVVVSEEGDEVEVTVRAPRGRKECGAYSKPKSGAYLIVDVTVEVTKGKGTISPFDFTFLLPDSSTTEPAGGRVTECGKDLDYANNMRAGTKRSGQLVFDVKPAKGQIVYKTRDREFAGSWKIG